MPRWTFPHSLAKQQGALLGCDSHLSVSQLYFIMILSFFVFFCKLSIIWLTDWFGTVLRFYVLYYCIIILCFSYLATWLPFLNKPIDWLFELIYFSCCSWCWDGSWTRCIPQRIEIRRVRWSLCVCSHCLRELGSTKRFSSPALFGPWPKIDWHFRRKPRNQLPVFRDAQSWYSASTQFFCMTVCQIVTTRITRHT